MTMVRKTAIYRWVLARILAVSFLILLGVVLDYYLIIEESSMWWFAWIITDAIVFFAWVYTMWMSWYLWGKICLHCLIVYAVHLVPQVATLFKLKAPVYDDE